MGNDSPINKVTSAAGGVLTKVASYGYGLGEASDVAKALGINGGIGGAIQNANTQLTNNTFGTWGPGATLKEPAAPASAQPTLADANATTLSNTLKTEGQNYWQRTNLTGAQGLLDGPLTASQTLLGS